MGIALGRNPNGIIQELRVAFAPLATAPMALATTVGATAVVLGLRLAEVIDGGVFAALLAAGVLSGPLLLRLGATRSVARSEREARAAAGEGATVPLEWVGIDRPFTREDVAELDRELGLEAAR
jgi:hypothetical protein